MAQIACKYHNERPAKWFCDSCQINFCASCIPKKLTHDDVRCPVCHQEVSVVAAENSIESFWNRLPTFFLYPINISSLTFLILLSFTSIGIKYDPLLAISIPIIVTILFLLYAYSALEQTAKGHMQVPAVSLDLLLNKLDLPLKQILILVAAFAVNFTVYDLFGFTALVLFLAFSIIASPASIMVLATEYSFFKAFNPLIVARLIIRLGKPYFILCAFLTLLVISSEVSFNLMTNVVSDNNLWPVYFFINMYFVLIMYNMMGYVIFQYHEKLGYEIEIDLDNHHAKLIGEDPEQNNEAITRAEILIKEGKVDLAVEKLIHDIEQSPADFPTRAMFHKLLKVTGKTVELGQHASSYIERLLGSNKQAIALDVLIETRELIPSYLPDKAKTRYEMAILLDKQNFTEIALACINNLHRDHPSYDGIPRAYFLAAKIMCEKMGNDSKAVTVLEYVLNNYSVNALEQDMRDYIAMVKNLNDKET